MLARQYVRSKIYERAATETLSATRESCTNKNTRCLLIPARFSPIYFPIIRVCFTIPLEPWHNLVSAGAACMGA